MSLAPLRRLRYIQVHRQRLAFYLRRRRKCPYEQDPGCNQTDWLCLFGGNGWLYFGKDCDAVGIGQFSDVVYDRVYLLDAH